MRKLCAASCVSVLLILGVSLFLPGKFEVQRTRELSAPRSALHARISDPSRWKDWAPPWMASEATLTASLPERGVWCDIEGLGPRVARSAILYGAEGTSTHVTWILRLDVGRDPLRRWGGLFADGRLGSQMEEALDRLATLER